MENRTEPMQEQAWWKLHCASCLLVFCAVVWRCWCWLRSEWGKKTIQIYPYSNCTFHHQNSQRKQTNFYHTNQPYWKLWPTQSTVCDSFSIMENRRETMQEQAWWKLHCASCLLVFCVVVWYCLLVTKWAMKKNIQTYPYSNCTFHHQSSQRKQTSFTVPTDLGKTLANIICCMCLFQHVGKQDRTHARTSMVKIALRKLFAGILCGCVVLLVGCEVSDEKKNIQTYPYSNCTFHHQNSQRKQTNFTVPTNLGRTLANIIHCMCFFQHNGKQNRTHARTSMVKIALRKLFAGILCGCVVLLVLVAKWVREKNHPNLSIF